MIAVDTNIFVRFLVDDDTAPSQVLLARTAIKKAKKIFVPQLVQAETVWVLKSAYNFNKRDILQVLQRMSEHGAIVLQYEISFANALMAYAEYNVGFSDCLILEESKQVDCKLITFDKKFSKLTNAKLLSIY